MAYVGCRSFYRVTISFLISGSAPPSFIREDMVNDRANGDEGVVVEKTDLEPVIE